MTFNQKLNEIRRDVFDAAFDPDIRGYATINELADAADLSWTTVENMYRRKTRQPRFSTIFKLAKAVGYDVTILKEELANVG